MVESILYLANISNPDRISADSGWRFADILLPAVVDRGVTVTFAGPIPLRDPRVRFIHAPTPRSKYRARLSDVRAIAGWVARVRPSVVVVNQIETAPAVRAAVLEAGSRAAITGYCHYLPFSVERGILRTDPSLDDAGLGWPLMLHFLAGLLACDRVMVQSATAAEWVEAATAACAAPRRIRAGIVPPPRDPALVRDPVRPRTASVATAVYNHRLYEHYGTRRFVDLAERLTATGGFRIRVMDLFGSRAAGRNYLDSSPERYRARLAGIPGVDIVSDHGDRTRYRATLEEVDLAIAPFRPGCPWSMSVIDCQAMGIPVIAPRMAWMAEHVDPDLLFDEPEDGVKVARRLVEDPMFWAAQSGRAHRATRRLTPERIATTYLESIS
jgi:hypothetical protein